MNIDILKKEVIKALSIFSKNNINNEEAVVLVDEYFDKIDIEKLADTNLVNNITSTSIAKIILYQSNIGG